MRVWFARIDPKISVDFNISFLIQIDRFLIWDVVYACSTHVLFYTSRQVRTSYFFSDLSQCILLTVSQEMSTLILDIWVLKNYGNTRAALVFKTLPYEPSDNL